MKDVDWGVVGLEREIAALSDTELLGQLRLLNTLPIMLLDGVARWRVWLIVSEMRRRMSQGGTERDSR